MCDVSGCSSEAESVAADDGHDGMLDILEEFQRLYQQRLERLERNPTAPHFNKEKMKLLEDWIDDLNQQNRTLVDTVKELESEASQRCEMLESRLVSTTSSTKQYMLQLHQLQQQVQQLMNGRLQAEGKAAEMTSLVQQLTEENEQLRRGQDLDSRLTPQGDMSDCQTRSPCSEAYEGASSHVLRLEADLRVALREKDDLVEILDIRKCELEESQEEVSRLKAELDRHRHLPASPGTTGPRHKTDPPAEVHRLQRHCRDLVDQRNQALAELAQVKVQLMEVMEDQVDLKEDVPDSSNDAVTSESDVIPQSNDVISVSNDVLPESRDVIKAVHLQPNGHAPPLAAPVVREQPSFRPDVRVQDELEERAQLIAALQGHLASARNEVALKDETLARLEGKLEAARQEATQLSERLLQADGERAALSKQNQMLTDELAALRWRMEESSSAQHRLEGEADTQMDQITELQERLLASERRNTELTQKCVERDVEIGRQWTTINSLQEAVLEAKGQVAALQPGQSFLGSLLGGGDSKKHLGEIQRLKMELTVVQAQLQESVDEAECGRATVEQLRDENSRLGQTVTQLTSQVTVLESIVQPSSAENDSSAADEGADAALVEVMFERLQTDLEELADTLEQCPQGQTPPANVVSFESDVKPARSGSSSPVEEKLQGCATEFQSAEQQVQTEYPNGETADVCCDHQEQLIKQRDTTDYLKRLLQQRFSSSPEHVPSLETELNQLATENRQWRRKVTQGQRQLADLRRSLTSLRQGVEECKKEDQEACALRRQLQLAREEAEQQAAATQQLAEARAQLDLLILEKQHQQHMIRELQSDLAASEEDGPAGAPAASPPGGIQPAPHAPDSQLVEQLSDQLAEQRSLCDHVTGQLADERCNAQKLTEELELLRAEHAECAERRSALESRQAESSDNQARLDSQLSDTYQQLAETRGQLSEARAQLAEARAQLAETLCGQEEVHSQADIIVEHVTGWLEEWRAENQRLSSRVQHQTETITALHVENRHLVERLELLHTPSSIPYSSGRPPSLHKLPSAEPGRPSHAHSRRALFTPPEGFSLTERYPGSFTEGCLPTPAQVGSSEPHRHSLTEGFPLAEPHRQSLAALVEDSQEQPHALSPAETSPPNPMVEGRAVGGGTRPRLISGCDECETPSQQGSLTAGAPPAAMSSTSAAQRPQPSSAGRPEPGAPRADDWPYHQPALHDRRSRDPATDLDNMVADMHDRRPPSLRLASVEMGSGRR